MTGLWDIHNHILPDVDDGACCIEEAMDMLIEEYKQGVRHVILTPHYRKGMFEVSRGECFKVFQELVQEFEADYRKRMPDMVLEMGCEFHIHPFDPELLSDNRYLMPGDKNVLIEFRGDEPFSYIVKRVKKLRSMGFTCIIAHAERYMLKEDKILRLHKMKNVYIQVNADSISGRLGFFTKMKMKRLLKLGAIDLIASDAHNMDNRTVGIKKCADWITGKFGEDMTRKLFCENPRRIFGAGGKNEDFNDK